jgi:hypothetical protein
MWLIGAVRLVVSPWVTFIVFSWGIPIVCIFSSFLENWAQSPFPVSGLARAGLPGDILVAEWWK